MNGAMIQRDFIFYIRPVCFDQGRRMRRFINRGIRMHCAVIKSYKSLSRHYVMEVTWIVVRNVTLLLDNWEKLLYSLNKYFECMWISLEIVDIRKVSQRKKTSNNFWNYQFPNTFIRGKYCNWKRDVLDSVLSCVRILDSIFGAKLMPS